MAIDPAVVSKAQRLSKEKGFDYDGAISSGYSPSDIAEFLGGTPSQPRTATPSGVGHGTVLTGNASPKEVASETAGLKSTWENFKQHWPAIGGATVATLLGQPEAILPAMGLAGFGGAAGEGAKQVVQQATSSPDAPATPQEAGLRMLKEGAVQAAGEGVGRVAAGAINVGQAPFINKIKPGALDANAALKAKGGGLTAGQMSDSTVLNEAENAARGSMIGYGKLHEADVANEAALKKISGEVADKIGQGLPSISPTDRGELFADAVSKGSKAHSMAAKQLFQDLDDAVYAEMQKASPEGTLVRKTPEQMAEDAIAAENAAPVTKVPSNPAEPTTVGPPGVDPFIRIPTQKPSESGYVNMSPLKDLAGQVASTYQRISNIGKSEVGGTLLDRMEKLPNSMTFSDAQELRSQLLSMGRDLANKGDESKAAAVVSKAAGIVDAQMETAAKNAGGDIYAQWRGANKFWKFGKDYFNNDFVQKVALSGDVPWERVGEKVFQNGNVEQVLQARNAVRAADFMSKKAQAMGIQDAPKVSFDEVWPQMKAGYYESLLNGVSKDGTLDANALFSKLNDSKVSRTLKAALPSDEYDALKNFATTAKFAQSKTSGPGGGVLRFGERGALVAGMAAPFSSKAFQKVASAASSVMLITPAVLSRMLTNPKTVNWLTVGLKLPQASPLAAGVLSRIGAAAAQAEIETSNANANAQAAQFRQEWNNQ